jgi:HK97 family phage major capsid protein
MASTKLVEAQERLGEKQQLVERVLSEAGSDYDFTKVKALGEDLDTQGKVERFRELNTELNHLTEECKRLEFDQYAQAARRVREEMAQPAPSQPSPHPTGSNGRMKSLGQMFVESDAYESFRKEGLKDIPASFDDVELKTLFQTSAGWEPESTRTGIVVSKAERPIQILDLIPLGQTSQPSVVYMEETTRTHSSAERAEGTTYAESQFELTERSSPVRKITDSIPVTDEQLEDESQVRSYLDNRLSFGIRQRLDSQIVGGDGSAPNLLGIVEVSGIQTQAKGTDPRFDAVHKALTKVRVTGRATPNAIAMHANDWQRFRLTRTADGIYILGNPAQAGPMSLFGLPVALNEALTEGTALVGDYQNFCQLHERRGVEIRIGFVANQFKDGIQTIRADMRAAFTVFRPEAFATVTGLNA